ncbi:MAG: hypothetical protein V7752_01165 [Halopseudomonas sp.]
MTVIEIQQEQLRQQYLAAMGVTPWLPRQVLPGAAPSPVWRWRAAELDASTVSGSLATPATSTAAGPAASERALPNKAPLRQLLSGQSEAAPATEQAVTERVADSSQTSPSPSLATAPVATALVKEAVASTAVPAQGRDTDTSASVIPRFRLAMVSYQHCLVVTELPTSRSQSWSDQHQQLLDAIVVAVGLAGASQASSGISEFQWPLDPLAKFDQSEPIARRALELELTRVRQPEQQALLLMGQAAFRYLLPLDHDQTAGQLIECQQQPALCCYGLNEVLRIPGLKAELWRQLQPLRNLPSG